MLEGLRASTQTQSISPATGIADEKTSELKEQSILDRPNSGTPDLN